MRRIELIEREPSYQVIGAFYAVHKALGFGFLEQVYSLALACELQTRGRRVAREVSIPIHYNGRLLTTHRIDMIVDHTVVVEIKSTFALALIAWRQTLNYLRASNLEVALLLHFGPQAKFYRIVNSSVRVDS